jgi:glycosyltransferase involved in cell wall biosynthesis
MTSSNLSVIMPCYNSEDYIEEAIRSILNQTYHDFELIIIDDLSTDNSVNKIMTFKDERIRLVQKEQNSGYTDSLNLGLQMACGVYVARMDADDVCHPERFQKQISYLDQHNDVVVCGTWFKTIPAEGIVELPSTYDKIKSGLLYGNVLCHPSVMLRRKFFIGHSLFYNRSFEPAEDYELWTRVIALGRIHNIPEVLLYYREHSLQVSSQKSELQNSSAAKCRKKMLTHLKGNFLKQEDLILDKLVTKKKFTNYKAIIDAVNLLNELDSLNQGKGFYLNDDFKSFVNYEKKFLIRNFFVYNADYKFQLLYYFLKSKLPKQYLTRREQLTFVLKCILSRRSSSNYKVEYV